LNYHQIISNDTTADEDMDMELMVDDFVTFFIAGQETTANTLAFCFMEIGRNDDIFKKAREEVDRVLGERNEITYQDAVDLKYCSCIFKEALRLYPPAPVLDRFILDDLIINGYKIPKNSIFHVLNIIYYYCYYCLF
jgi:cholesterol 24(S)-hydroxylase